MKYTLSCLIVLIGFFTLSCSKSTDSPAPVTPPISTTTTTPPSSTTTAPPSSTTVAAGSTVIVTTLAGNGIEGYVDAAGAAARFKTPTALVCDLADNIYVADNGNARIRRVSPAGVVSTLAGSGSVGVADGTGTSASFFLTGSNFMAREATGNLLLSVQTPTGSDIRRITPAGVVTTLVSLPITIGVTKGLYGMAIAPNGDLYVSDGVAIERYQNGKLTVFAGSTRGYANGTLTTAQFSNPNGLAFDADGNLYVADDNACIRKVTPAGAVSLLAGQPGVLGSANGKGSAATFRNLTGLVADKAGNLYVTDNMLVRRITPDGTVTTVAGSGTGFVDGTGTTALFRNAQAIAIDSKGVLYVADYSNQAIRKIVVQ